MKLFILGLLLTTNAFAFQCKDLSYNQAKKAAEEINKYLELKPILVIDKYCEACFDKYPKPILVHNVDLKRIENTYQVTINSKATDLSYIYVEGKSLSHYAGCETVAVSKFLN